MQREIKFRGKRVDNGEWVAGHYYTSKYQNKNDGVRHFISYGDHWGNYEVIPETVGQLLFKTICDLELFDGDIFDIGQTVNGQSEFVITQGVYGIDVNYNFNRERKYEYSIQDLLRDDMDEIKIIGHL